MLAGAPPVFADDFWHVGVLPGLEVPGWLVLALRRHAEQAVSMTDDESASFGPLVAETTAILKEVAGAERVYVYAFGDDAAAHWHVLLAARPPEIPQEHRRGLFIQNAALYRDEQKAQELAEASRRAFAQRRSATT